jgi:diacylglycerol O-acyltransferase / wax synthase
MDRLTPVDAAFLTQEQEGSHMHIGAIMVFEGPPPKHQEFLAHIESRLHLVPRYRQKLAFPRFEMGRPVWVDDPSFNLGYHVRYSALPSPGSVEQLRLMAARLFSQRLDRTKPLWEIWVVEGLADGRFALVNKTHHCLVDGVSGVDVTTVLFDLEREPASGEPDAAGAEWLPSPEPSEAEIVAEGIRGLVRTPLRLAGRAASAVASPGRTLAQAREAAEGVGEVAWGILAGTPETPLNQPIGPHRRLAWAGMELDELKAIKNALGGTVNDVFLGVVSGALARWLRSRGVRTEGLELRGCVPVSIRAEDERGTLGNRITAMTAPLPVYADDPVERLSIVSDAMKGLKESKQALGAEVIVNFEDFQPPTIFARASRLHFSTRVYNLLVTNVPGPQFPLYLLGRELDEVIPVAFLAPNQTLAVAIMSYNGKVNVSLIGDYDAMPDLDELAGHVTDCVAELLGAAESKTMPAATT